MAASSVMQSILVSPVTGVAKGLGSSRMIPCCYLPRQQRNSSLLVRCMAEDGRKEEVGPTTASPPSTKAKVSTNFFDVFAFSGPAPERINGRLAMIGFVTAVAIELAKGEDVFAQISDGGIPWFLYVSGVLSAASLIPMFSGVSVESKSKGFFNSDAELWNGRFAMVGLVALAVTELVKGGALVKKEVGTPATSLQKAKVSTDFFDVFAFSGPAPERINGRLAMIGFVAAIAVELSNGQDVFAQISNGGIPWFSLTTGVLSVASLIPQFSGVSVESKSKELFSADAEMWNGRFAMVGLVAWAFTEFAKGGALV